MLPLLLACAPALPQDFDPDPEKLSHRILVLYNAAWPDRDGDGSGDSEQVARHYAKRRGVPARNLLGLACSPADWRYTGLAGWQALWDEVVLPVRSYLTATFPEDQIVGLVLCHGLPYQIDDALAGSGERSIDETLIRLWSLGDRDHPPYLGLGAPDSYFEPAPAFGFDEGRFDPAQHLWQGTRTYLVARLDGPDAARSLELCDLALYAEAYLWPQPGYYSGNGYVDTQYGPYTWSQLSGYPYPHSTYDNADRNMAYGRQWIEQASFPLFWEPWDTEIGHPAALWDGGGAATRAPAALWYFGWYNLLQYHDAWEWLPGSAASDLDSLSIIDVREENPRSFLGSAFRRGLTCGVGVIGEPYLDGHCYPESFAYYLLNGYTFAEAARVSDPRTLWRNLYLGDFLYNPLRSGKQPLLDVQPPPPARVRVLPGGAPDQRVFETFLDTAGFLPDLGRLSLHHGPTPAYGAILPGADDRPRLQHRATLSGLGPDELLHFRADYTDPAGNVGTGADWIHHTALAGQPVLARVVAPATVPSGSAFDLELVFGAQAGVSTLTDAGVTVTSAALGWNQRDALPLLLALGPRVFAAPDGTLRSARATVPGTLPPDTYRIEARAASPAGGDLHVWTLVVQ